MAHKIAIALAAYKPDPNLFSAQLQSILEQSERDWRCFVTLDSPQAEITTYRTVRELLSDPRFELHENSNRLGHKKNFEHAAALAIETGASAIAFCDQDDVWYPEKIEKLWAALRTLPPNSLVHSDADILLPDGSISKTSAWKSDFRGVKNTGLNDILIRNVVSGCSLLMHSELAQRFPVIPDAFKYHDHWFASVAAAEGKILSLSDRLYSYRQHGGNVVGNKPYRGLLHSGNVDNSSSALRRAASLFRLAKNRALALENARIQLPLFSRLLFLSSADLGVSYAFKAVLAVISGDLPLFRACVIRAVGKILFVIGVGSKSALVDDT